MPFQINAELHYQVRQRSTVLLNIHALSTNNQTLSKEQLSITPGVKWEEFPLETGENRYLRLDTGDATQLDITYSVLAETKVTMVSHEEIHDIPVSQFRRSSLPYLFPSRYAQSDRLGRFAIKEFGGIDHPYDQAVAITDWIFNNIDYISGTTDTGTSAFDTLTHMAGAPRNWASPPVHT